MDAKIFISYPSENQVEAINVCDYLEHSGIKCWIAPRDMPPGEWAAHLVKAIGDCEIFLLIFSSYANDSPQVKREVDRAVSKGKIIVPVRIEEAMPSDAMEFCIGNTHWLDAFTPSLEAHLDRLQASVSNLLDTLGTVVSKLRPPEPTPSPKLTPPGKPVITPSLDHLQPSARRIIEQALSLAKRCRESKITHRSFMASFVSEAEGFASRVCRITGADPHLLWTLLVALSSIPSQNDVSQDVPLTSDAFARVVTPTLKRASEIAANPNSISECELFHAFCDVADPTFCSLLSTNWDDLEFEAIEVDLKELRSIDPTKPDMLAGLTLRARRIIHNAHQLAQQRRVQPIPNRLFLAAFLLNENGHAWRVFAKYGLPALQLVKACVEGTHGNASPDLPLNSEACSRIIAPTILRARKIAVRGPITERLLFRAFCEVAEPQLKTQLKAYSIDLDSLANCDPDAIQKSKPPEKLPSADPKGVKWN